MSEPTDSSPRRQRLLFAAAALAAALVIGGVVAVVVDDDGDSEPAREEVGGDTGEDSTGPTDLGAGSGREDDFDLDASKNPVREAREQGIPIIKISPKQAREGGVPPEVQKLLEEKLEQERK